MAHLLRKAAGTKYRWPKKGARCATNGSAIEARASQYVGGQSIPLCTLDARHGAKGVHVYLLGFRLALVQSFLAFPLFFSLKMGLFILCH